jgi:sortase A
VAFVALLLGLFLFSLYGYLVVATGLTQHAAQRVLRQQLGTWSVSANPARPATALATAPWRAPAPLGAWLGTIEIPRLGLDQVIVEGVGRAQLALGPGHYPGSAPLGSRGNSAVAGHRTTYGAPFAHLDRLRRGDDIIVTTAFGRYVYRVRTLETVAPSDVAVLAPTSRAEMTLTTCTPPMSAAQRLIVIANLTASSPTATNGATSGNATQARAAEVAGGTLTDPFDVARDATFLVLVVGLGARWISRTPHRGRATVVTIVVAAVIVLALDRSIAAFVPASL